MIEEMRVIANIYIGLEKSSSGFKLVLEVSDASKLEFAKGALKTALNKLWVDVEQRPRSQKLNKFLEINYTVSLSKDDLINIYASINNPSSSAVALTLD